VLYSIAVSPNTLLLLTAGAIGSIVVSAVGLLIGIGHGHDSPTGPEPTLLTTSTPGIDDVWSDPSGPQTKITEPSTRSFRPSGWAQNTGG